MFTLENLIQFIKYGLVGGLAVVQLERHPQADELVAVPVEGLDVGKLRPVGDAGRVEAVLAVAVSVRVRHVQGTEVGAAEVVLVLDRHLHLDDHAVVEELGDDVAAAIQDRIALGRLGHPEEIASAVGYLASDAASYVTGQVIGVNGGRNT